MYVCIYVQCIRMYIYVYIYNICIYIYIYQQKGISSCPNILPCHITSHFAKKKKMHFLVAKKGLALTDPLIPPKHHETDPVAPPVCLDE